MNRIIKNKRYDTETAEQVAEWDNSYPTTDFKWYRETLYRKKTGEFFLHGEGGAMSRYSRSIGNNEWSGGEKLIPLTDEAAAEWAQEYLTADEYERIFGPVEDETEVQVSFKITKTEAEKIKASARNEETTQLALFRRWIESL